MTERLAYAAAQLWQRCLDFVTERGAPGLGVGCGGLPGEFVEEFRRAHLALEPSIIGVGNFTGWELAKEAAERQGLVGDGVFLDRQGDLERLLVAGIGEGAEPLTEATGAGEDVDDGNCSSQPHARSNAVIFT